MADSSAHFPRPTLHALMGEEVTQSDPLDDASYSSDLAEDFDILFDSVEQEWQEQALCAEADPEVFFPVKGGSTRVAKRICKACAVRDECLEYALEHDERFGIWGGLSERERRRVKRQIV